MASDPNVSLWVKAEPFSYGALHIAPHPRLNFTNIKKIVIYAKTKAETGFPRLSYSVWRHIACNKLHLSEELAWLYFSTCHLLSENTSAVERLEWDHRISEATDLIKDGMKNKVRVGTLKFVLFLYIQQLNKVSLKASLVAGDEWPTRSSSPDLDTSGRNTPRNSNKVLDDHSHMVFIQNNIHEILELLLEHDTYGSSQGDLSLTLEAVEALGFILAGSVDRCKTMLPIQDIAMLQTLQHRSGYSKLMKSFSLRLLQNWIKDSLVQNPFGISACIASGRRLSWPMGGDDSKEVKESSNKRGRIATNAHVVPKEHMKGNKIIIMSQVGKQTISRSSSTLENSSVKIHRCHSAFLYLLAPLRSVTIEKCHNTTVILGPVETHVYLSHCESVTLIACTRMVTVSSCTLCNLYLLTPNPPVVLSGNDSIRLAPYHTYYPKLEEHMAEVGIGAAMNMWDHPLCIGPDHKEDAPVWELLPPSDFFTFNIPFEMEGATKEIPGGLPSKYHRAIAHRSRQIDSWQKTVKEAGLSREQRKQFQALVESQFHLWLSESGHKRELDNLAVPQAAKH
ncbi:TBCC domain-containing protein 1-like isoform X2 [Dreissena polymorpha]|uniref:TBCC domain-containing protein 1-like isoform X2 n=1 Tax=Dreissena polymorpha TaxID=45954 RepID=UPI002263DF40|nr:TBCC domain-containing protein 1-like isoform X2 [Dreissena polymorpha]